MRKTILLILENLPLILDNVFIWAATMASYIVQILPIFQLIAVLMAIFVSTLTAFKIMKNLKGNGNEKG